jgi:hypothetical protein
VRIAINVMRARLTIVGFNLAIITFQLSFVARLPSASPDRGYPAHLGADVALLMGLALSVAAMISFIASSAFDEQGTCTHWSLLAGDLFMFLGLAQCVSGFFAPFVQALDQVQFDVALVEAESRMLRLSLPALGGAAWFLAMYVGPAVSLLRSPFGIRVTTALGLAYLALLVLIARVSAEAFVLESAQAGADAQTASSWAIELLQPVRW